MIVVAEAATARNTAIHVDPYTRKCFTSESLLFRDGEGSPLPPYTGVMSERRESAAAFES
jgi:hypothetical protein